MTTVSLLKLEKVDLTNAEITAGSSLININDRIFVCSDDQYTLYELDKNEKWIAHHWGAAPTFPNNAVERKKFKPDFEALVVSRDDSDKLLMIPSGSKKNRTDVMIFDVEEREFFPGDMKKFYLDLSATLTEVNIEGAEAYKGNYLFLNRGVQDYPSSLIIADSQKMHILSMITLNFGKLQNVPLHGSELCLFENSLYILAVAEDANNSFDDGSILGSALFKLSLEDFTIIDQWIFDRPVKLEGLCRYKNRWLTVSDSDGAGESEFYTFIL